jgi:hypothetical protein
MKRVALGVLVLVCLIPTHVGEAQYTPAIGCRGVPNEMCIKGISVLQKALREWRETSVAMAMVDKWEIVDFPSLVEATTIRSARTDGNYESQSNFAAFFSDRENGVTPKYPNHVLVTTGVKGVVDPDAGTYDRERMAFIAGFIEGANQGHAMEMVQRLK